MPSKSHPLNTKWLNAILQKHGSGDISKLHSWLGLEEDYSISYRRFLKVFERSRATEDALDALVRSGRKKLGRKQLTLEEIIDYEREETALPKQASFYTKLAYSRFLTCVPGYEKKRVPDPKVKQRLDAPCVWCNERSRFVEVNPSPHLPRGTLQFKGVAVNNLYDGVFVLVATRVSSFLFTVTGYHPRRAFSFQATFTKCYRQDGRQILSGSWIGMDHLCHSSQFRCLIAAEPIDHQTIARVLKTHSIRYEPSANRWEQAEPPQFPSDILAALGSERDRPGSVDKYVQQRAETSGENITAST